MARGRKTGGRVAGTPNKVTLERALQAQEEVRRSGHKLCKDILSESANHFWQMAVRYAPHRERKDDDKFPPSEEKFAKYMDRAVHAAGLGAAYESPKLQATALQQVTPEEPIEVKLTIVRKKASQLQLQPDGAYAP